ncbi:PAS domain-containing protein [Rheinheimera sp. 1928-s]|uniref:PAS domain-containing protein n=1 Tax=Rheinheimera sp. 1928-s TaxID=3033803 RepID=UPI0026092190|nr:PAS domain-containing protein [Rheinheimera sp. 1928-s]MDF3125937.1 PAS domain-containing protein [Rheinheimera sp. 1928-s]
MSDFNTPHKDATSLRQQANERLKDGSAQCSDVVAASAEALAVLYQLSSAPDTAGDGLKLLHELQTYQVELDMQLEQLQANELESSHELNCYRMFFEMSPTGCMLLRTDGVIMDCNLAAARLFGITSEQLLGQPVDSLLNTESKAQFRAALARLQSGDTSVNKILTTSPAQQGQQSLELNISLSPDRRAIMMMVCDDEPRLPS